jgi:UDP-GlcNAc3NAcA epimerase
LIITIIGNRPQIIKAALVSKALRNCGITEKLIYTWQHYDNGMSVQLMRQLELPYKVSAPLAAKLNKQPVSMEDYLQNIAVQVKGNLSKIKAVLVYGDTNATLAGALFAKKNRFPLIHVEAGERSFNNQMPEEQTRIATDFAADLLLCVNRKSLANLRNPMYTGKKIVVGDVMLDALLHFSEKASFDGMDLPPVVFKNKKPIIYFTMHRQSNANTEKITGIIHMLGKLPYNILWPVHPRITGMIKNIELPANFSTVPACSYLNSLALLQKAKFIITDSGGLQKEAYWMQKKCITLRADTEWTETLKGNWNSLYEGLSSRKLQSLLNQKPDSAKWGLQPFGNGKAAGKVAAAIKSFL